jgi:ABC-type transporter Mla MlaB component
LTIGASVGRKDIPAWCARLRALLESGAGDAVVCDVAGLAQVDATAVDLLARLRLTARRCGRAFRVRHASPELQGLLSLVGLAGVVPLEPASALPPRGKPEEREPPRGVEEEAAPDDGTV